MNDVTVQISGEAGFGIMSAGTMLAKAFSRAGYHILATNEYPSLIRGGQNTVTIKISSQTFFSLTKAVHVLVALNAQAITQSKQAIVGGGCILFDPKDVGETVENCPSDVSCIPVSLSDIASSLGKDTIVRNTIAIGSVIALLGIDFSFISEVITDQFAKKGQNVVDENIKAAQAGYTAVTASERMILDKPQSQMTRYVMNASEAVGLGAIEAGMKFAAIYPMTPINALISFFADNAEKFKIVYKQPEDEIAGINMAIGASLGGVRSMVATSGGGFSLMVEGLSLAGITETPIVIDLGMRPGPATGMPTWTEQGELWMAIHAGHGEFPRIILAPGDAQEAYSLTIDAFEYADYYQIPAFILTDKYLNESQWCTTEESFKKKSDFNRGKFASQQDVPTDGTFKRYALDTQTGVSMRTIPGMKFGHYIANSYEHDEKGFTTEESRMRIDMSQKRMKKHATIVSNMKKPLEYGDDNADVTFVSWGSTKGIILEAMNILKNKGIKTKLIHFTWVYPLDESIISSLLTSQKRLVCVENNSTGQLAQVIREETGVNITEKLLKFDGRQWYPEEIAEKF